MTPSKVRKSRRSNSTESWGKSAFRHETVTENADQWPVRYIDEGKKAGAKVETGGQRHGKEGYFIQPTIFSNVTEDMKIMQEEIFGPVCSIAKFKTAEDAIRVGNTSTYGLAAAVHTSNLKTAIIVSNALRAGTVCLTPSQQFSRAVLTLSSGLGEYLQHHPPPDSLWRLQGERYRS